MGNSVWTKVVIYVYESFKVAYNEINATSQAEAFADGFSIGLRLGIESYNKETEYEGNGEN